MTVFVIILLVLLDPCNVYSQGRKPLSVEDIEDLLRDKVSPRRVATLIEEHGVNFNFTGDVRQRLQKAGNDTRVMQAVEKAAAEYATRNVFVARPKVIKGKDGAEMVVIPAGEFWMGSDDGNPDEKPRHRIYLDTFYIDKYEVTNVFYRRFMDATGRAAPSYWNESNFNAGNQPVVGVEWEDADAYCKWAGKRLTSEAEWEKAGKGLDGRKYPWGNQWDSSRANSEESKIDKTVPVGSYFSGVSPYGVHDMAGNVWEWVADWYDGNYYQRSPNRNPKGPESGRLRVLRGGAWNSIPRSLRTSNRSWILPTFQKGSSFIGFRCAQ